VTELTYVQSAYKNPAKQNAATDIRNANSIIIERRAL
jgi:hypothetical protein